MRHGILALLVALFPFDRAFATDELSLAGVRDTLEQWVETRRIISRTQSDWLAEKEMLEQTAALFERQLAGLKDQLDNARTGTTQVDKERAVVEAGKAEMAEASERIKEWATKLEQRITTLSQRFPPPLLARLEPLTRLIPEDPAKTRLSGPERLRNIVGILNEVDRFNSSIVVESELRQRPSGEEMQVKTLYLGLGQAYYVDRSGTVAGTGTPTPDGWVWKEQPELASAIQACVEMYETRRPPAFVELPFNVH